MYAEKFDDFRRKMLAKKVDEFPYEVRKLETVMKDTPLWETWMELYNDPDGDDIYLTIEPDTVTYTFYTIVPRKAEVHV